MWREVDVTMADAGNFIAYITGMLMVIFIAWLIFKVIEWAIVQSYLWIKSRFTKK